MTPEKVRIVMAEMTRYGISLADVGRALGVHRTAVSHAIYGKRSRSERIRRMVARMVLARKLRLDMEEIPDKAVENQKMEFFGDG